MLIYGLFGLLENFNVIVKVLVENYCVMNIDLWNYGKLFYSYIMNYYVMV